MEQRSEMKENKPHYGYYVLSIFAAFAGAVSWWVYWLKRFKNEGRE
jgi:hypothetical protein